MRYVNYRICLDIQSGGSGVILTAKRGDTGRRLWVTLTDGGQPYLPGSDCFPVFTAVWIWCARMRAAPSFGACFG